MEFLKKFDSNLVLNDEDIHVWLIDLRNYINYVSKLKLILDEEERTRADKYHFEKDHNSFVISRAILKHILGFYAHQNPKELKLIYNKYGKPYLNNSKLNFNISHSHNYAALAFNYNSELGIDIEKVNRELETDSIINNYFSDEECSFFMNKTKDEKTDIFFTLWSRKEAYIKTFGEGLNIDLSSFGVNYKENPKLLNTHKNIENFNFYELPKIFDYKISLANIGEIKNTLIL